MPCSKFQAIYYFFECACVLVPQFLSLHNLDALASTSTLTAAATASANVNAYASANVLFLGLLLLLRLLLVGCSLRNYF